MSLMDHAMRWQDVLDGAGQTAFELADQYLDAIYDAHVAQGKQEEAAFNRNVKLRETQALESQSTYKWLQTQIDWINTQREGADREAAKDKQAKLDKAVQSLVTVAKAYFGEDKTKLGLFEGLVKSGNVPAAVQMMSDIMDKETLKEYIGGLTDIDKSTRDLLIAVVDGAKVPDSMIDPAADKMTAQEHAISIIDAINDAGGFPNDEAYNKAKLEAVGAFVPDPNKSKEQMAIEFMDKMVADGFMTEDGRRKAKAGLLNVDQGMLITPQQISTFETQINALTNVPKEYRDLLISSIKQGETPSLNQALQILDLAQTLSENDGKLPSRTQFAQAAQDTIIQREEFHKVGLLPEDDKKALFRLWEGIDTNPQIRSMQVVKNALNAIKAAEGKAGGVPEIAILYAFVKLLDPGSVVREGELAIFLQARAGTEKFKEAFKKIGTSTALTDSEGKAIKQFAVDLEKKYQEVYDRIVRAEIAKFKAQGIHKATDKDGVVLEGTDPELLLWSTNPSGIQQFTTNATSLEQLPTANVTANKGVTEITMGAAGGGSESPTLSGKEPDSTVSLPEGTGKGTGRRKKRSYWDGKSPERRYGPEWKVNTSAVQQVIDENPDMDVEGYKELLRKSFKDPENVKLYGKRSERWKELVIEKMAKEFERLKGAKDGKK